MKIYCPKCHTCYSVEIGLIPIDGKKFRCSQCNEVWLCTHKDFDVNTSTNAEDSEEKSAPQNVIANEKDELLATPLPNDQETETSNNPNVDEDEMNVIFARLKNETTKINEEIEHLSAFKRVFPKIKKMLGWDSRFAISIEFLTILIITVLSIFANRYELVRKFPQAEQFFNITGMPSRVIGEGLEFQNITRKYLSSSNNNQLNIKGFIFNSTDKKLNIPFITVNILDEDTNIVQKVKKEAEIKTIEAKAKIPFSLEVNIPPQQAKYVVLTFSE